MGALVTPRVVVGGLVLGGWALAASYALEATHWAVMTDELQTVRLAISVAETLSPVPSIHDEYYGALSQLYPLLLAPLYGVLSAPDAFTAAHALNALLLATAGWPAYLLGRAVSGSPGAGYAAAALTVFTPWLVLSATLLTENAAYPASVWAVLFAHRALVRPSPAGDLGALAALFVAFLARTQLLVLGLALPVALVCHEIGFAAARAQPGSRTAAAACALRRIPASHPVLTAVYAAGAVAAVTLALFGSLGRVVGNYADTFSPPLLPGGVWQAAAVHLDHVVVAGGIVPFLLAVSFALMAVLRPGRREEHAFAMLLVPLVVLLTLEAASFDLRFTPGAYVQSRYLCYLTPLFAVGSAAAVVGSGNRAVRAVAVLGAGFAFVWLAGFSSYDAPVIFWASPAAAFQPALESAASAIGVATTTLVRLAALVLAGAVAVGVWRAPRTATLWGSAIALAGFGAVQAAYVFDRFAVPATTRPATLAAPSRDWIDGALPPGSSVALLPSPYLGPGFWWDAEFWNRTVERVISLDGGPTFSPFASDELSLDFETGRLDGTLPTNLLVVALNETRLHFVEAAPVATATPLRVVRIARPHRIDWATRGADPDGWLRPRRPVNLRFYRAPESTALDVVATLSAPPEARTSSAYTLRAGRAVQQGTVSPGSFVRVRFTVCPARGAADATLSASGTSLLPDGRAVSLHLDRIETTEKPTCP